jgi:hypothetical protein
VLGRSRSQGRKNRYFIDSEESALRKSTGREIACGSFEKAEVSRDYQKPKTTQVVSL